MFGPADKASLQAKIKTDAEIWRQVLRQADAILVPPPTAQQIREGKQYWKSEYFLAGSLAYWLTGEAKYKDAVVAWMKAHVAVDVWGVGWMENLDIPCNWYTYYMSLAYDILYDDLSADDRKTIRDGIVAHAKPVYEYWINHHQAAPYDQNHTYVPLVALATAGLAFYEDVPEAKDWLALADHMLRKSRRVLTTDGYYYEGTAYWEYAFHWHMRWADLMTRATGRNNVRPADLRQEPPPAAAHVSARHAVLLRRRRHRQRRRRTGEQEERQDESPTQAHDRPAGLGAEER